MKDTHFQDLCNFTQFFNHSFERWQSSNCFLLVGIESSFLRLVALDALLIHKMDHKD